MARAVKVGSGRDTSSDMGPVKNKRMPTKNREVNVLYRLEVQSAPHQVGIKPA